MKTALLILNIQSSSGPEVRDQVKILQLIPNSAFESFETFQSDSDDSTDASYTMYIQTASLKSCEAPWQWVDETNSCKLDFNKISLCLQIRANLLVKFERILEANRIGPELSDSKSDKYAHFKRKFINNNFIFRKIS